MDDCHRLIREFCALACLTNPEAIARGASIEVSGVRCAIMVSRHDERRSLTLYCDFGSVPGGREPAIYQELLAQTFSGSADGGAQFGFSRLDGHVVCMQTLRAADMSAQRLIDVLHHLADKALEWRQTYFLNPTSSNLLVDSRSGPKLAILPP